MKHLKLIQSSLLLLFLFSSMHFLMADKQLDMIMESYNDKVVRLEKSYENKKSKYKEDVLKKLESLKKQKMMREDLDEANNVQQIIKKLQGEPLGNISDNDIGLDFDLTPPPPGTPPVSKQEKRKFKRLKTPEELHKALKSLNPVYQGNGIFELEDGKIVKVNLESCYIVNIAPLAGLKYVRNVEIGSNPFWDLSPLKKLNLNGLSIGNTDVRNLDALKDMKLNWLNITNTKIKDISVLKKMPLTHLLLQGCIFIDDFSPLEKCRDLEEITLPPQAKDSNIDFLKKFKKLKFIDNQWRGNNKKTATQFWKEIRAK